MKKLEIHTGTKFNRFTIISETERYIKPSGQKIRRFKCECECGNIKIVSLSNLRNNVHKSCGCFSNDNPSALKHSHCTNYNMSRTYVTWLNMKARCNYSKNNRFKHYGGRGIKVCHRWLNSFENFLKDMGERPKGTSIDRINVDGNYEPGNCRWSTPKEQENNKRRTKKITN
jgi:hypothetical protein